MKGNGPRVLPRHCGMRFGWTLTFLAATLAIAGLRMSPAESTVTVGYRVLPARSMDGNWAALLAASDGKVYAGLACHGCMGHLVFYDSAIDRWLTWAI